MPPSSRSSAPLDEDEADPAPGPGPGMEDDEGGGAPLPGPPAPLDVPPLPTLPPRVCAPGSEAPGVVPLSEGECAMRGSLARAVEQVKERPGLRRVACIGREDGGATR